MKYQYFVTIMRNLFLPPKTEKSIDQKPGTEELCRLLQVAEDEQFTVITYLHYNTFKAAF